MFRLSLQLAREAAPVCGTIPCQVILCNNDKLHFADSSPCLALQHWTVIYKLKSVQQFNSTVHCTAWSRSPHNVLHSPSNGESGQWEVDTEMFLHPLNLKLPLNHQTWLSQVPTLRHFRIIWEACHQQHQSQFHSKLLFVTWSMQRYCIKSPAPRNTCSSQSQGYSPLYLCFYIPKGSCRYATRTNQLGDCYTHNAGQSAFINHPCPWALILGLCPRSQVVIDHKYQAV